MAKSKETFGKKEREKRKQKQRIDKQQKMDERKSDGSKGKSLEDMMAYVDENGNLSSTPTDIKKMRVFNQEDIKISTPKQIEGDDDIAREGVVSFFNDAKGYGFIKDIKTGESIFVHANQLTTPIKENNKVSFEAESGPRGLSAVNVKVNG